MAKFITALRIAGLLIQWLLSVKISCRLLCKFQKTVIKSTFYPMLQGPATFQLIFFKLFSLQRQPRLITEIIPEIDNEVLGVGENRLRLRRAPVGQLVSAEFRHVNNKEEHRSDGAVEVNSIARSHIAKSD